MARGELDGPGFAEIWHIERLCKPVVLAHGHRPKLARRPRLAAPPKNGRRGPSGAAKTRLVSVPFETLDDLETAMTEAHADERWEEALTLADQLVLVDPDASPAWQIRAISRTYLMRHEEALGAYDDALHHIGRLLDEADDEVEVEFLDGGDADTDPRAVLHFNRACELAFLGRREEAFDGLRASMAYDPNFGPAARRDDYFKAYFRDPEFLELTRSATLN